MLASDIHSSLLLKTVNYRKNVLIISQTKKGATASNTATLVKTTFPRMWQHGLYRSTLPPKYRSAEYPSAGVVLVSAKKNKYSNIP